MLFNLPTLIIMETLRRFMEEDEMDYTEVAEAAINKRKYLLNRLFEYEEELKGKFEWRRRI